jgi:hypothetical protein
MVKRALLLAMLLSAKVPAFDLGTSLGPGLGGAVVLSESSASTLLSVPSGGIHGGQVKLEMSACRRFEIKDLDQLCLAAAWRHRAVTAALGVSQFGYRDLYAERTARLNLACQIGAFSVGACVSGMMVETGGYDRLTAAALGAGAAVRAAKFVVAATADNLNAPSLSDGSPAINPRYAGYAEYVTSRSFSTVGRVTLEDTEEPQFGVGQLLRLSDKAVLFWGFSTAPILYGGGLELNMNKGKLTYATSIHPVLGFTHQVSLSFTFGGKPAQKEKVF